MATTIMGIKTQFQTPFTGSRGPGTQEAGPGAEGGPETGLIFRTSC